MMRRLLLFSCSLLRPAGARGGRAVRRTIRVGRNQRRRNGEGGPARRSPSGAQAARPRRSRARSTSAPTARSRSPTSPATSPSRAAAARRPRSRPSRPRAARSATRRARCSPSSRSTSSSAAPGPKRARGIRAATSCGAATGATQRLGRLQHRRARGHPHHRQVNLRQHPASATSTAALTLETVSGSVRIVNAGRARHRPIDLRRHRDRRHARSTARSKPEAISGNGPPPRMTCAQLALNTVSGNVELEDVTAERVDGAGDQRHHHVPRRPAAERPLRVHLALRQHPPRHSAPAPGSRSRRRRSAGRSIPTSRSPCGGAQPGRRGRGAARHSRRRRRNPRADDVLRLDHHHETLAADGLSPTTFCCRVSRHRAAGFPSHRRQNR